MLVQLYAGGCIGVAVPTDAELWCVRKNDGCSRARLDRRPSPSRRWGDPWLLRRVRCGPVKQDMAQGEISRLQMIPSSLGSSPKAEQGIAAAFGIFGGWG